MKKLFLSVVLMVFILLVTSFISGFGVPTSGRQLKLKACNEACQKAYNDCRKKKPKLVCDTALEACQRECKKKHG